MPNIRLPLGRPRTTVLVGTLALLAALAPAAAAAGPAAGPAKPGAHHLSFHIGGASHQDVVGAEAVRFRVTCPTEACTVVASASTRSPAVHSRTVRSHLAKGDSKQLTLPVAAAQCAKLASALERGKAPSLTVRAIAKDTAGNSVPLTLRVAVTRS
jgi:hypothetical protein